MHSGNIFHFPKDCARDAEFFEDLVQLGAQTRIERIVSCGQTAPPGGGYFVQAWAEWVMVLQGSARIEMQGVVHDLGVGDWLWIGEGVMHRVVFTSSEPPCVWCAVHVGESTASCVEDEP